MHEQIMVELHHCPQCGYTTDPATEPRTPEADALWEIYHADPATIAAQAEYTAREVELQDLRNHYNIEIIRARLAFQKRAHAPMLTLTRGLQALGETGADCDDPINTESH